MSGIVNLHRILSRTFEHEHPECPTCEHYANASGREIPGGFVGYCYIRDRVLCCAKRRPCRLYEPSAPSPDAKPEETP